MAHFRYKAMTGSGAIIKGVLDAPSQSAVVQKIRRDGHFPISAVPENAGLLGALRTQLRLGRRPSLQKLGIATQELSALLLAGIELDRALGILMNLGAIGTLRQPFGAVRSRVRAGTSFADALARESFFPKFYVSMVRAGEMGGTLAPTLRRLADYLARTLTIRETVLSALVYPAILMVTAGLSITFILTFVLPQFEPLFAEAGKTLPLPTRIVMGFGDAFRDFWWVGALLALGTWLWFKQALQKPAFRRRRDAFLLRVPVLGPLMTELEVERFSRSLGTLLSNGVPLPTALGHAQDILWNQEIASAVRDTARSLREGEHLARRLAQAKIFPTVTLDLIQIGEETGKLDEMLLRQADLDEQRIRHSLDRLLALLVPGLTIILGLVVAGLIASMLVAILSVNDLALQ